MAQAVKHIILSMGFTAGADMSTGGTGPNSSFQYTGVKLDTATAWKIQKAGAGEAVCGILQNQPKSGSGAEVAMEGVCPMVVDGNAAAIAPGDRLKTDASGRGIKTTTDKDPYCAVALEVSTAQNDVIAVRLVGPGQTLSV